MKANGLWGYFSALILFFSFFKSQLILAQDIDLGDGIKITTEQLKKIEELLPKTKEDKVFYHWTKKATGLRWITQGSLDQGEIDFLNRPSGDRQVFGPGVYLAESPTSSKQFGDFPVAFKIRKGTALFDNKAIYQIIGRELTYLQASKLGEKIPLIRHTSSDWFLTNHKTNASQLSYAHVFSPEAPMSLGVRDWNIFEISSDLKEAARGNSGLLYLYKLLVLSDYMDGISFARALKVNPAQPWNEFDPENFDTYLKSISELKMDPDILDSINDIESDSLKKSLAKIYSSFSNTSQKDFSKIARSEGVRVGGDFGKGYFTVYEHELKSLQENPYLDVVVKEKVEGKYLVEYFYPDAFHFKKLQGRISNDLYEELKSYSSNTLMTDHNLRRKLNQRLIQELIDDVAKRYKGLHFKHNENAIKFMNELVSIHPFDDFNGRSIRTYFKIGFSVHDSKVPYFMMSDNDLFLSPKEQLNYLNLAKTPYDNLKFSLVDEYAKALAEKRLPNYAKSINLDDFISQSIPVIGKFDLSLKEQRELIRRRQWAPLLELVMRDGVDQLALDLSSKDRREGALKKLASFDEYLVSYQPQDVQDKIYKLMTKELAIDVGEEHFNLFEKYKEFHFRQHNSSYTHPDKIKDELVKNLFERFENSNLDIKGKNALLKLYLKLESNPMKGLEDMYQASLKVKAFKEADAIDSFIDGILSKVSLNSIYADPKGRMKFFDLMLKITKQNLKSYHFKSILKIAEIKKLFLVLSLTPEEKEIFLNLDQELKSGFREVLKGADPATKQFALGTYSQMVDDIEMIELLSEKSVIDGDQLIRKTGDQFISQFLNKYNVGSFKAGEEASDHFLGFFTKLNEWIQLKIKSKSISDLSWLLRTYTTIYERNALLKSNTIIKSPQELARLLNDRICELMRGSDAMMKSEAIQEITALKTTDAEYLRFFDEGFFHDDVNYLKNTSIEYHFKDIIHKYKGKPELFLSLESKDQIAFLNSYKNLLSKKIPKEFGEMSDLKDVFNKLLSSVDDSVKVAIQTNSKIHACAVGSSCKCVLDSLNQLLK